MFQSHSCDIYVSAFSDQGLTTAWSDPDIVLSAADSLIPEDLRTGDGSVSLQTLTVKTDTPFSKSVYIAGVNTGYTTASGLL